MREFSRQRCSVEGCKRRHKGHGYCELHLRRIKRQGSPEGIGKSGRPLKGDVPSWDAAHKRVHRVKGKASQQVCVDCGRPAREWSYDGTDPAELRGESHGFVMPYSLNPDHYVPRCSSCHRLFDNAKRRATIRYDKDATPHFVVTVTEVTQ